MQVVPRRSIFALSQQTQGDFSYRKGAYMTEYPICIDSHTTPRLQMSFPARLKSGQSCLHEKNIPASGGRPTGCTPITNEPETPEPERARKIFRTVLTIVLLAAGFIPADSRSDGSQEPEGTIRSCGILAVSCDAVPHCHFHSEPARAEAGLHATDAAAEKVFAKAAAV